MNSLETCVQICRGCDPVKGSLKWIIFFRRESEFCPPTKDSDSPPKNIYFKLPFTGSHALQIRTQVSKLCSSAFPQVTLHFIFQSGRWLSGFFPFKGQTPMLMRSHVVYKYTCWCCRALYLGQTRRHLHTRISEYMGVLPSTGKKQATTLFPTSSIQAHICQTNHIISSCRSLPNFELLIHESLLISFYKPSLNEDISSAPLSLFYCFPLPYVSLPVTSPSFLLVSCLIIPICSYTFIYIYSFFSSL